MLIPLTGGLGMYARMAAVITAGQPRWPLLVVGGRVRDMFMHPAGA
jgi:hypothetical protein